MPRWRAKPKGIFYGTKLPILLKIKCWSRRFRETRLPFAPSATARQLESGAGTFGKSRPLFQNRSCRAWEARDFRWHILLKKRCEHVIENTRHLFRIGQKTTPMSDSWRAGRLGGSRVMAIARSRQGAVAADFPPPTPLGEADRSDPLPSGQRVESAVKRIFYGTKLPISLKIQGRARRFRETKLPFALSTGARQLRSGAGTFGQSRPVFPSSKPLVSRMGDSRFQMAHLLKKPRLGILAGFTRMGALRYDGISRGCHGIDWRR